MNKLYIGSDHAGFKLKQHIKKYLEKQKINYKDLGAKTLNPKDDYPDYAKKVSKAVLKNKAKGILICGTGQGICIAANKNKKVIAALAWNKKTAEHAKKHLNSDILCIPGFLRKNKAKKLIKIWLKTKSSKAKRHSRRLNKIKNRN